MKLFNFSLLVVVLLPLLCSGLQCYTCEDGSVRHIKAHCTSRQGLKVTDCPGQYSNYQQLVVNGKKGMSLGCSQLPKISEIHYVNGEAIIITGPDCWRTLAVDEDSVLNVTQPLNYTQQWNINCICQTDLCNLPSSLRCLSCKGTVKDVQNGCTKGEKPYEKTCSYLDEICMFKWYGNGEMERGCGTKFDQIHSTSELMDQVPGYYHGITDGLEWKLFLCNSDICNDNYNDPALINAGNNTSRAKTLQSTCTFAVALASISNAFYFAI